MKDIRVDKAQLLTEMRHNRDTHQAEYDKAVIAFRSRATALMEQQLELARNGGEIKLHVSLPVPEIHTDDYERAIAMLEWELDKEISLTETDFNTFVLNKWGWAASFTANTMSYNR